MDRFATLLADLGTLINVPLHPDSKRLCRLNIDNKIHIQIQEEENQDRLLVACFVGEIPAGKFRENLLKATLKENNAYPRLGTFAYSARNNQLALFAYIYYPGLHGDNFADFLGTFLEKAFTWKTALETGRIPERGQTLQKTGPSIFDIQKK
ncbi:MAG: CesT family type III secretion system chaperone [Verrucomicrobia bacterium]|nr:CesT family type III secretion system chaperone [Verrucomicrobiota bacterium]